MTPRTAALLLFAVAGCGRPAPAAPEKPELLLITSLPLVVGERFALDAVGSPVLTRLDRSFRVRAIGISDRDNLGQGRLLLMAHPRAQPAEALVDLDRWVLEGGRVVLLADPRLDWPSARPLGDRLRPPPMFADTGLLRHWGLRLDAPATPGPERRQLGRALIAVSSPGRLRRDGSSTCVIASDDFVARCRIGRGRALIVADADFLNVPPGAKADINLDSLAEVIGDLARTR